MVKKTKNNQINNLGKYGKTGGPGRPKGKPNYDGLTACLNALKEVVSKEENIKLLEKHFDSALKKNPLGFYYRFVMPLLPKNIDIGLKENTLASLIEVWEKNNETK